MRVKFPTLENQNSQLSGAAAFTFGNAPYIERYKKQRMDSLTEPMRRYDDINSRLIAHVPQVLPVLQLELVLPPNENEPPPADFEAKEEIFLLTSLL